MNDVIVSMNVFHRNNEDILLLNKNEVPILFYWNRNDDLKNVLISDNAFREIIDMNCFNSNIYTKSYIGYTILTIENKDEKWENQYIDIQDLFPLSILNAAENEFYKEYIKEIIYKLYERALYKPYTQTDLLMSDKDIFINIFEEIKNKYPGKFEKNTYIKYIHAELSKTIGLHDENIQWIMEKLNNILN